MSERRRDGGAITVLTGLALGLAAVILLGLQTGVLQGFVDGWNARADDPPVVERTR